MHGPELKRRLTKDHVLYCRSWRKRKKQIACKGHAVGSASASISDALTLTNQEKCAKVCVDGVLEIDIKLKAWRKIWSHLVAQGNAVINVDAKSDSSAGVLWIGSRILMLHEVCNPMVDATCTPLATGVEATCSPLATEVKALAHEWYYIDVTCVANLEHPEISGFVVAESTRVDELHVRAVIVPT